MSVLLFWNVGKQASPDVIAAVCREHDVDILVLAECDVPSARLVDRFDIRGPTRLREVQGPAPGIVRFCSRIPARFWEPVHDDRRWSIRHINPPIGIPLLLVAVHLPSKLRGEDDDRYYVVRQLRDDISKAEKKFGHQNTVVMGDFNLNPFEKPMLAADGLHAMMDKDVARRLPRTVQGTSWDYFYNPMWSRLGDESDGPPGSYFYADSGVVTQFWHMFDQVLLRPGLLTRYRPGDVSIISHFGGQPILNRQAGRDGHSDHLPIMLKLAIEMEVRDE